MIEREREKKNVKATEFHLHFFLEFHSVNMEYDILMEFVRAITFFHLKIFKM
jgi:hypothetical protein